MEKLSDIYKNSFLINKESEPEFFEIISDIYKTEEFGSMAAYIQHGSITRIQHILSVAYMSYIITKEKNLNYRETARGAMLHDLFYYDWHVAGDGSHRLHGYRHPRFALKNAEKLFPLSELEKNIILRHMWPLTVIPPKYKESLTVCLCDKYCANRETFMNNIILKQLTRRN